MTARNGVLFPRVKKPRDTQEGVCALFLRVVKNVGIRSLFVLFAEGLNGIRVLQKW